MEKKHTWHKPTIKVFDSAKDFIQGVDTIGGVKKEIGTPSDTAFANSIISP